MIEYNLKDLEYKPVIDVAELEEGKFYAIKVHTDEEHFLDNCKQLVDILKENNICACIIPEYREKDVEIQEVETIEKEYLEVPEV